jgi:hypothetical protein
MINLFRKVRQKLINENSLSRYVLYATGEILLVVIGILIALQVNNWNEDRKNRKDELFYYLKLAENLRQDTTNIMKAISEIDHSLHSIDRIVEQFETQEDEFLEEDISSTLVRVEGFTPEMSTWNNLIATGKINLLTSQAIIDSLTNYYNKNLNDTQGWYDANKEYSRNQIGPYLMGFDDIQWNFGNSVEYQSPFNPQNRKVKEYKNDVFIRNALVFKKIAFLGLKKNLFEDYRRAVLTLDRLKDYNN